MNEQLFKRVPKGKSFRYEEYSPLTEPMPEHQIEPEQVTTLLSTLVISMLMAIEGQLPPHAKLSREVKLLEQAVLRFASINGAKLDERYITAGVNSWNCAVRSIQKDLIEIGK